MTVPRGGYPGIVKHRARTCHGANNRCSSFGSLVVALGHVGLIMLIVQTGTLSWLTKRRQGTMMATAASWPRWKTSDRSGHRDRHVDGVCGQGCLAATVLLLPGFSGSFPAP